MDGLLGQPGTADSVDAEYFNWESDDRRFVVHMHLDAIDGLARDVMENAAGLPLEAGGILLGQAGRGERSVIWIERYQRVEIQHRSGPDFVLHEEDHSAFEEAARRLSNDGELSVVGFYRSHLRPGFQLEASDTELVEQYFTDPEDLFLLLKPEKTGILAQFFGRRPAADEELPEMRPLGPAYPFRGRMVTILGSERDDDPAERTSKSAVPTLVPQRRLVPDFQPAGDRPRPAREFFMDPAPAPSAASAQQAEVAPDAPDTRRFLRRHWPLPAALVLVVAGIAAIVWQASHHQTGPAPAAAQTATAVRPLGLYVDPSGQNWKVSWNPSASLLQGARSAKLFIRDGDNQNAIDLTSQLQDGVYEYPGKGRDVTFRLEVTDAAGRLEAESFRVVNAAPPPTSKPAPVVAAAKPESLPRPAAVTAPVAIHRVAPVVPASIRPRIKGTVSVDVRVKVDAKGRVLSAAPVEKPRTGVDTFLASRAVYAARQWRFKPARQDGKAVAGAETIRFDFK